MSMYSRHAFRAWLHTLPPDEPFCEKCRCPITEYMTRALGRDGFDNLEAQNLDRGVADAIDMLCGSTPFPGTWSHLTPRRCIAAIDQLQERVFERIAKELREAAASVDKFPDLYAELSIPEKPE